LVGASNPNSIVIESVMSCLPEANPTPPLYIPVIAVSSPHRKEAFVVCEEILEQVKAKAQIWKREHYEGDDEAAAEWKANA
jgi:hypothetical protein